MRSTFIARSFCFFHDVPLGCPRTLSQVLRDGRREWKRDTQKTVLRVAGNSEVQFLHLHVSLE